MAAKSNQHIVILGAGESGTGAAILAQKQGYDVFVSDNQSIPEKFKYELLERNISFEENGHTLEKVTTASLVIKSPGIPSDAAIMQSIRENHISIISEIEFADRFTTGQKIGITGSNGKTTTATLVYQILSNAGLDVALAGNIGSSFSRKIAERDYEYWVLELSSFQLDDIEEFRNQIGVILNITPDHLNRYNNSMESYADAKFRISLNQKEEDYLVYNYDDPVIQSNLKKHDPISQLLPFSEQTILPRGAYIQNDTLIIKMRNEENPFEMKTNEIGLKERHNRQNAMAASIVGEALEIRKKVIRESLQNFKTIEHRLEKVLTVHGIEFINDSKGSNVHSTWYALESTQKPIIWIAGGIDKGNDYSSLEPLVKEKVKALICLGKDNKHLTDAFENIVPQITETQDMAEAVKLAYEYGKKGDTVLLSPACSSFDLFNNFEDRGDQFKRAVYKL